LRNPPIVLELQVVASIAQLVQATLLAAFRVLPLILLFSCAKAWSQLPNIVLIVADDLGWKDVGYNGSEINTPNIDALAEGGVTLTDFYVHPTCSPTRAALMTGQSPMRHGIDYALGKNTQGSLPLSLKLLPEYLGEAGYQSVMVGKWHLGHATSAMLPMARGFEQVYGHFTGGVGYWDHVHGGGLDWHRHGKSLREEGYATHLQADEAVRLIRERDRERPLFLYTAFSAPHLPNEAPAERIAEYGGIDNENRRIHAAMVDELDRAIGRIIATLHEEQMHANTLIWFFSDNGGLNPAAASDLMRDLVENLVAVFGRPLPTDFLEFLRHNAEDGGSDNGPYRRGKGAIYQGGILVPSLLYWPGTLEPSSVSARVTVQDVLPTLAQVAGVELLPSQILDGSARWATINGESTQIAPDFVAVSMDEKAILVGHWKLVVSSDTPELYNLADDPFEQFDRSADQPILVEKMQSAIDDIPHRESINQSLFQIMIDPDRFGGEEDRQPWADVVRQAP
jgi:arylsulfatase A-like enzyme